MAKKRSEQGEAMIECVLNHSPQVVVMDEIGSFHEANAVISCSRRGVRFVASAHGNLKRLVKNQSLNLLLGGIDSVILSDAVVIGKQGEGFSGLAQGLRKKHRLERVTQPVFDIVIELESNCAGVFWVTKDTTKAVDAILLEREPKVERRERNEESGEVVLSFFRGEDPRRGGSKAEP